MRDIWDGNLVPKYPSNAKNTHALTLYLYEPERLFDVPADWEVVDGDLPQLAHLVDHEQTAEGDPGILLKVKVKVTITVQSADLVLKI